MKVNIIGEDNINIEGLTKLQLALIEEAIYILWYEHGDYKVNVDERKNMLKEFDKVDVKKIFNLENERKNIQNDIDKIMKDYKHKIDKHVEIDE